VLLAVAGFDDGAWHVRYRPCVLSPLCSVVSVVSMEA
jgi:hypothetical protein